MHGEHGETQRASHSDSGLTDTLSSVSTSHLFTNTLLVRAVVLGLGLLLLTRNVDGIFDGWHEWNSAAFSVFARNHIEYGLGYTKLFCTWGDTADPPAEPRRYLNHPPLLAVWAAIPMWFFGCQEWVARSVPIIATLASAWILMVMVSRLQSATVGAFAGFFYVILPATAYFGRILSHEAPVQFFSLLMLHGYLQWSGLYPGKHSRRGGLACYATGAVLGIGTGWATVLMAGLIWCWHLVRSVRNRSVMPGLLRLTLLPAASLGAVFLHTLWGLGWDISFLGPLIGTRVGTQVSQAPVPSEAWLPRNWRFLLQNFSSLGLVAGLVYLFMVVRSHKSDASVQPFGNGVVGTQSAVPIMLTLLQGVMWILVFTRQSWVHEYWQFLLGPFVAMAMASAILSAYLWVVARGPRVAFWVLVGLVALPMPLFAMSLDRYHDLRQIKREPLEVLIRLGEFVPPRIPVFTSSAGTVSQERFGNYVTYWPWPQVVYYAHRPLIQSLDFDEIAANHQGAAAYILEKQEDPKYYELYKKLAAKYSLISVGQRHLIFFLTGQKVE